MYQTAKQRESMLTKKSSQLRSGLDGHAQATEFSEQSSTMEAMLALNITKKAAKLRVITTRNFNPDEKYAIEKQ